MIVSGQTGGRRVVVEAANGYGSGGGGLGGLAYLVHLWSNCSPTVVKVWSKCGRIVVKLRSNCGQRGGSARNRGAVIGGIARPGPRLPFFGGVGAAGRAAAGVEGRVGPHLTAEWSNGGSGQMVGQTVLLVKRGCSAAGAEGRRRIAARRSARPSAPGFDPPGGASRATRPAGAFLWRAAGTATCHGAPGRSGYPAQCKETMPCIGSRGVRHGVCTK